MHESMQRAEQQVHEAVTSAVSRLRLAIKAQRGLSRTTHCSPIVFALGSQLPSLLSKQVNMHVSALGLAAQIVRSFATDSLAATTPTAQLTSRTQSAPGGAFHP